MAIHPSAVASVVVAAVLALAIPARAHAVLDNDAFVAAAPAAPLPFTAEVDLSGATTEPGEPQWCNFMAQSVWYVLSLPAGTAVDIDSRGSDFGVVFNIYRAFGSGGLGSLSFMNCVGFGGSQRVTSDAAATYYIQAGSVSFGAAALKLHVTPLQPPVNDAFANAVSVALPFAEPADTSLATLEPGEPSFPGGWSISGSVWYAFTPSISASYTIRTNTFFTTTIGVYTGSAVDALTQVAAKPTGTLVFRAIAGTTYRIQIGRGSLFGGSGQLFTTVRLAADPSITTFANPADPSMFDAVSFQAFLFDPEAQDWAQATWRFGDGATAAGAFATHTYAADGDYTATLDASTADGRTATTTRTVSVRTHDIAITHVVAPQTAHEGQSRKVAITLVNTRYDEVARLELYRATPTGLTLVAEQTLPVPVLRGGRATQVSLDYTFTADDATLGKTTLVVQAALVGARDALPSDNSYTATPILVK
jgi:hypothetical protein